MIHYDKWLESVEYSPDLDGGGRILAPHFEKALRGRKFGKCLEWGCGPAWIGLWLLENGIIEHLTASDINPAAVEAVRSTATATGWNVEAVVSDNLKGIVGTFDLVVISPPKYCDIQTDHYFGRLRADLRPSDVNWCIHREFYANIAKHLTDLSELWIVEMEPFSKTVSFLTQVYDVRPNVPLVDFVDMMADGGLRLERIIPFDMAGMTMTLLKVRKL